MACRIELSKEALAEAIDKQMQSEKRAANTTRNPFIKEFHEKQLRELTIARNTITEVK